MAEWEKSVPIVEHFFCDSDPYYRCQKLRYPDRDCDCGTDDKNKEIKSFIKNLLATQRTSIMEEIEKMKKPINKVQSIMTMKKILGEPMSKEIKKLVIYNQALDDLLSKLKEI